MRNKPLLVIFLTVFIDLVGFGIIIPLSPFLARKYGADPVTIGWLMTVYSGMQFLLAPFWGALSDRWGRRPVILLSLFGAGMSHLLFAFADHLWLLFVARGLAGIFGANISTAMAYIADVTPREGRSKGMGLVGAAFGLGFILGPALGGIFGHVGEMWGSEPPFGNSFAAVVAGLICWTNWLFALKFLPESLTQELRGKAAARPSRFSRLWRFLRQPVVGPLMLIFFFSTLAMAQIEQSLFLWVQDRFQWDLTLASFGFAYVGLVMVFTQGFLIRKILPLWGERMCLTWGLTLSMLGFAGIGLATSVGFLALAVTSLGLGVGLVNPSINGSLSLLTGASEQGEVMGTNQSLSALARVVGPVMGGWFYRDIGQELTFFFAAVLVVMGILLLVNLYSRIPQSAKQGN